MEYLSVFILTIGILFLILILLAYRGVKYGNKLLNKIDEEKGDES